MKTPKTTKFTLKRIVERLGDIPDKGLADEPPKLTPQDKSRLMEMASMFETFGECLRNENALLESAKGITELCELAETYAITECGDWFQQELVTKDMKELKRRVQDFSKLTKEAYARLQQLGILYEDIGHVLGRYYDLKSAKQLDPHNTNVNTGQETLDEGNRVCAWCKAVLGPASTAEDTHTICPSCLAKYDIPKKPKNDIPKKPKN